VISDLCNIVSSVSIYQQRYISMIDILLSEYYETCFSKYTEIVSGNNEVILSSRWVATEIREIYDAFIKTVLDDPDATLDQQLVEKEIHQIFKLKDQMIVSKDQILIGSSRLQLLANIHISLDWLVSEISKLRLEDDESITSRSQSEALYIGNYFEGVLSQYRALSKTCINILRLEVRTRCLYFLDHAVKQGNYVPDTEAVEPDSHIVALNKDLLQLEEIMAENMPNSRLNFLFGGLPLFLTRTICRNAKNIAAINRNGIMKMSRNLFALQQNLAQINATHESNTSHDSHLDMARHFYNLLNFETDNLIAQIEELGEMLSLEECEIVLDLVFRNAESLGHGQLVFSSGPGMINSKRLYDEELQKIKARVHFRKSID